MAEREAFNIGSRRELFVDDFLVEEMKGGARRILHAPRPREIVLTHDRPWEGNTSAYHTFLRDGDRVLAYYRGSQQLVGGKRGHIEVTCVAESTDGIVFRRPRVGLIPFRGSLANNIILTGKCSHNMAPFLDTNPACPAEARYKAFGRQLNEAWKRMRASGDYTELPSPEEDGGLYGFVSPDGLRWTQTERPLIRDGAFDSQNVGFWDDVRGEYRAYYRDFHDGIRGIKTATSPDFAEWTPGKWLDFDDACDDQLYTNQILPYERAPHIYVGFPTRFVPDRGQITEGLFMSSRDGVRFQRFDEAFLRPGPNRDRWGNRCCYIWQGVIETPSDVPGGENELSIFSTEHYYMGNANMVRRFTLRQDGFVSVNGPRSGGELLTKLFVFEGDRLTLNLSTSAIGSVRVEIQDSEGTALEGFALDDCDGAWGDTTEHTVTWKEEADVSALAGKPVRLRFAMSDADVYSLRFCRSESLI